MEKRFKVGDIITYKESPGSKLRIIKMDDTLVPYCCDVLCVGERSGLINRVGQVVWTADRSVDAYKEPKRPKRPKPDEVITIKRFGDRTEAHYSTLAKTVTIKRYKNDKHDMHKACIYALDKLFDDGMDVTIGSVKYNGLVVCVAVSGRSMFNPGQLYQIKDGVLLHPAFGACPMLNPYKSFKDLCDRNHLATFMEVHL